MPEPSDIRVSYVLTTRNRAPFLEKTLGNVREYKTLEDELIVIDAASTDDTSQVVERHKDLVTLFRSEPDRGEAHGLNKGLLAARGRIIKTITDDDYFHPEAMAQAIALLEGSADIDAIMCGGESFTVDAKGDQVLDYYAELPPERRSANFQPREPLDFFICGLGLFFRRALLPLVGIFDTTFHAVDVEWICRLACMTNLQYFHVKLFRHVEHPQSGTRQALRCQRDILRMMVRNGLHALPPPLTEQCTGAKRLDADPELLTIMWNLAKLRRGRSLKWIAKAMTEWNWQRQRLAAWWRKAFGQKPDADLRRIEPTWDGSLTSCRFPSGRRS